MTETDGVTMQKETMETARELLMHQIAAGVHRMLYARRCTVAMLKEKLATFPSNGSNRDWADLSIVDELLAGRGGDKIRVTHLADIAFALDCEWDVKALKLDYPQATYTPAGKVEQPSAPATE